MTNNEVKPSESNKDKSEDQNKYSWEKPQNNIYRNQYKDSMQKFSVVSRLFFIWKGSVCKLIWHDMLLFIVLYALISIIYRNILFHFEYSRQLFEMICIYAHRFSTLIPITFLTGFYVSQVVNRWWDQFMSLPWPDTLAMKLVAFAPGTDDFTKNLRRTCMRYVNLSIILVFRLVSKKVMDRFPDYESLVEAKLMLPSEVKRLEKTDERTPHESTWAPISWAMKLITLAQANKKIHIDMPSYTHILASFANIEAQNRKILNYGWINFPLAYVQVATMSVFLYFLVALFGRQYLIPCEGRDVTKFPQCNRSNSIDDFFPDLDVSYSSKDPYKAHTPDFYFPLFTLVEFFCYMGWIKVAETLLNPFGDDDEDFQVNYIITRNLQVSYMIVDEADSEMELNRDPFLEAGIDIPMKSMEFSQPKNKTGSRYRKTNPMRSASRTITEGDNVSLAGSIASGIVNNAASSLKILNRLGKGNRNRNVTESSDIEGCVLTNDGLRAGSVPPIENSDSREPSRSTLMPILSAQSSMEDARSSMMAASASERPTPQPQLGLAIEGSSNSGKGSNAIKDEVAVNENKSLIVVNGKEATESLRPPQHLDASTSSSSYINVGYVPTEETSNDHEDGVTNQKEADVMRSDPIIP